MCVFCILEEYIYGWDGQFIQVETLVIICPFDTGNSVKVRTIFNLRKILMTTTLEQLVDERDSLDQKIKEFQSDVQKEAISKVLSLIYRHSLKENDLFSSGLT